MREQDQALEHSEPMGPEAVSSGPGRQLPRRRERRDQEPLLVEVAWLVIEAATVFHRLRRILARL